MRYYVLLLAVAFVALAACSDDDKKDSSRADIVPIHTEWKWVYAFDFGAFSGTDTLSYSPVSNFAYDGITDWYTVVWSRNEGDNPAMATVDGKGYRLIWPDTNRRSAFDRLGRKLPDGAARDTVSVSYDYYLAKYPVNVDDCWAIGGSESQCWFTCVSKSVTVSPTYGNFKAIQYNEYYEDPGAEQPFCSDYYAPGWGFLYEEDLEIDRAAYDLLEIIKPAQAKLPSAP